MESLIGMRRNQHSANNPLFPGFARSALEPGNQVLLDLLTEEPIDEATAKNLIRRAKALGDAMDAEQKERETRLRNAGCEDPDDEQRRTNPDKTGRCHPSFR